MSSEDGVKRDERTAAVENASYKWACIVLMYALLIEVVYRGAVRNEAAWDLLALACVPGIISAIYQARKKTMSGWMAALVVCSAVACAAFIAGLYQIQLMH